MRRLRASKEAIKKEIREHRSFIFRIHIFKNISIDYYGFTNF